MNKKYPNYSKAFGIMCLTNKWLGKKVIAKISEAFERFGFDPIDTPALEYYELLGGKYGEEGEKLMYRFEDHGGRKVALRYDLTVPLARIIANYPELPMPFKRYQIAPVWRADKPQKGRYREFMQCDVDIVGTDSWVADAEVIATIFAALASLEIGEIVVKINNRETIEKTLEKLKVPSNKSVKFIRIMDKSDKIGKKEVLAQLKKEGIKVSLADYEKVSQEEGSDYVNRMRNLLESFGVRNIQFDPTLARGLDYYTGTIFEFILKAKPEFGSIAGGGRYNNLIGDMLGRDLPAVGGSIGLDRLLAALSELEVISKQTATEVLIMNLDPTLTAEYLNILTNLRGSGIDCELYYESSKLDKQFKYAQAKNMKLAIIIGADEVKNQKINIKDLEQKKQVTVDLQDLISEVKSMLW